MDNNLVRCTIRLNRVLFAKFRYVAEYNGRSANKEIEQLIKRSVLEFEKEHGEIPVSLTDAKPEE